MRVKKFFAPTSREVLKRVREALGDDAVILSNRSVDGGVEILAIAENDMVDIVGNGAAQTEQPADRVEVRSLIQPGPNTFGMIKKKERKVQHALPIAAAASTPAPRAGLNAAGLNAAGLNAAAANAAAANAAASAAKEKAATDVIGEEIKSMRALIEQRLANTPAADNLPGETALIEEMKAMRAVFQQQMSNLARASEAQKALADRNLAAENKRLSAEIGTLRNLIERELAGLAWNETARRHPARAELLRRCLNAGFSAALARAMGDLAPADLNERDLQKWLVATLEEQLPLAPAEDIIERGGVYALVGPTGVGKTTTTAKLAARCAMKFGAKKLALVTMDGYRIGAQDHLRAFGKILGVPVHTAHDAASLADLLASFGDKHLVLIDTVGLGQRDERVAPLIQSLVANNVKRLLVLNAAAQPETLEDVIDVYQGEGLAGCVLSKIDEAVKLGGALDVLLRHDLLLHYVANGQRVPEDLHAPNARYLVHRALRTNAAAVYTLRDQEIGLTAAAAAAAAAGIAASTAAASNAAGSNSTRGGAHAR